MRSLVFLVLAFGLPACGRTTPRITDTAASETVQPDGGGASATAASSVAAAPTTVALGGSCGGSSGKACPSGSFCAMSAQTCKLPDATGTCKAIPTGCTKEINEVCGCDGKDYSNPCVAERAGTNVASYGTCADARKHCGGKLGGSCTSTQWCDYSSKLPGCGADDGPGTCQERPTVCPNTHDPVCGCDHKTYDNACKAHAAGVDDASKGPCS